jgi:hypothetical protein
MMYDKSLQKYATSVAVVLCSTQKTTWPLYEKIQNRHEQDLIASVQHATEELTRKKLLWIYIT